MKKGITFPLILILLLLTACSGEKIPDRDAIALVIIAGKHANANFYTEQDMPEEVNTLIERSIAYSGDENDGYQAKAQVAVIVSDSRPTMEAVSDAGVKLSCEGYNAYVINEGVKEIQKSLRNYVCSSQLMAGEEEVDLLGAISEAKLILDGYPDAEKHILILDTGITTAGMLRMQYVNILQGEVDDVLSQIKDGAFTDLSNINVTFKNLGNVSEPQKIARDDDTVKTRLTSLWTSIIQRCNGRLVGSIGFSNVQGTPMKYHDTLDKSGYPFVTSVSLKPYELLVKPSPEPDEPPIIEIDPITLETADLGFLPDSAEFRSEENANQKISQYTGNLIAYLNDNPENRLYVVGSVSLTSSNIERRNSEISRIRSNRVAELLMQHGVPGDRIITIDAGTTRFSWRNTEEFPDGPNSKWDVDAAQSNRIVEIFGTCKTEFVQELRDAGYID